MTFDGQSIRDRISTLTRYNFQCSNQILYDLKIIIMKFNSANFSQMSTPTTPTLHLQQVKDSR